MFGYYCFFLRLNTFFRYLKNNCEEFNDKESVIRHEEICQVRDVLCPYQSQTFGNCKQWIPFKKLSDHMKQLHNFDVAISSSCVTSKARFVVFKNHLSLFIKKNREIDFFLLLAW